MNLLKIIVIIVVVWFILKVSRFLFGIQIRNTKSGDSEKRINSKLGMDIQDADYEDVE